MNFSILPHNYESIKTINLSEDKKAAFLIYFISVAEITIMIICGAIYYGRTQLESLLLTHDEQELWHLLKRILLIAVLCLLYFVLRELINAGLMKAFCREADLKLKFASFCTSVSSNAYYGKKAYFFISAAPFIFFGMIFYLISSLVPIEWFWTVYLIQIINLSSAAGTIYVLLLLARMPKDILICDNGEKIDIFGKCD